MTPGEAFARATAAMREFIAAMERAQTKIEEQKKRDRQARTARNQDRSHSDG